MRVAFLFIFAFLFLSSYCQTDTTVIPLAAYWKTGDNYNFKVTKVKRTWDDKKLTQNDSNQYIASFRVIHADSLSYTIKWSFENIFFDVFGLPEHARAIFPNYERTQVIYKTNQYGVFTGIENWQEIRTMINDLIDEVIQQKSYDTSANTARLKESLQPLLKIYGTQRGIEQLVFNELQIFHFPFGKQYTLGEVYPYEEKIPVIADMKPVIGSGIIFLRNADIKNHRCEIVQRMKIHPDTAHHMLTTYFNNLGMKSETIDRAIESSKLNIMESNIFVYNYYPGIPEKLSAWRTTTVEIMEEKLNQMAIIIIERIEN